MSPKAPLQHPLIQWILVVAALGTVAGIASWHVRQSRPLPEAGLVRDPSFAAQLLDTEAPDINVQGRDGQIIRLSSLRGKVVLVNFWATWCPPCRAEIPDLEKLTHEMRHVPFEIFAVSSDNSMEDVERFFASQGKTTMLVGLDPEQKWAARYGTERLPESYVVDRKGKLRLRFVNARSWSDTRIHRYLEWLATDG